jgi:undecaprenyl-diphosphatase
VPWLLRWRCAGLAPEARKSLEVARHAGSAPALALAVRREGLGPLPPLALTLLPPALAGLLIERPVEERLGGPRSVAAAQALAGTALLLADRTPERRTRAGALDHLAVGLAQAAALAPGVSRSGAALTAARLRGLSRRESQLLALRAAVPVTVAAAGLKGFRAAGGGLPEGLGRPAAAGAAAALLSGFASLPLLPLLERRGAVRALAAYRIALGAASLRAASPRRHSLRRRSPSRLAVPQALAN